MLTDDKINLQNINKMFNILFSDHGKENCVKIQLGKNVNKAWSDEKMPAVNKYYIFHGIFIQFVF